MADAPSDLRGLKRSQLLTGNLRKTLFLLALPVLCEQFLNFGVGFVDTFLSGRLSRDATAAIGIGAYIGWLASLIFSFVGAGTIALVSRFWGAGEFDEANRVANRSLTLAGLLGLVVYAFIFTMAPTLALFLGMQGDSYEIAVRYLRIDGFGHLFTSLSLIGAAVLRGTGDMRTPMFILGMVSILNVLVSTLLVFGLGPFPQLPWGWLQIPGLGVDGIALGTVIARSCGGLAMITVLTWGISGIRFDWREMTIRGEIVRRIIRIGAPAAMDGSIMWAGHFLFLKIISGLDEAAFAAHIVGIRVEAITYLPAVAWGYASATMIGQSLGARNPERAFRVGHEAVLQCSLLALGITTTFFFGAPAIYHIMHEDPAVREIGIPAFRLLAFFQIPLVVAIIYVSSLRGAGDTRYPMLFTMFSVLCIRLPVAYLFGIVLNGGLIGAWIGMCSDIFIRSLLVATRYIKGRWVETTV